MEGWREEYLVSLADFINGFAFKPEDWGKDGLPIIRIEQLKNPNAVYDYYNGKIPIDNIIENGDLIFSWSASLFLSIWQNGRAALNQHLFKVVEKPNVNRIFLKYLIEYYLPKLEGASHGSTMKHITRKDLAAFRVFTPTNKAEQSKIAEILSTVDRAIEQTEALIAKHRRIKAGLMHDLLTRGIDEQGNIRSEKTHRFKDSPLGRIPEEWEVVELGKVGYFRKGATISKSNLSHKGENCILYGEIYTRYNLYFSSCYSKVEKKYVTNHLPLSFGEILFAGSGETHEDIGKCVAYVGEEKVFPGGDIIIFKSKYFDPFYLTLILNSPVAVKQKSTLGQGSSVIHIYPDQLKKIKIFFPSIREQKIISKLFLSEENNIRSTANNLNKLQKLKTALMQDLLTGRVRVTGLLEKEVEGAV